MRVLADPHTFSFFLIEFVEREKLTARGAGNRVIVILSFLKSPIAPVLTGLESIDLLS